MSARPFVIGPAVSVSSPASTAPRARRRRRSSKSATEQTLVGSKYTSYPQVSIS
jgi:hypothetical protein